MKQSTCKGIPKGKSLTEKMMEKHLSQPHKPAPGQMVVENSAMDKDTGPETKAEMMKDMVMK